LFNREFDDGDDGVVVFEDLSAVGELEAHGAVFVVDDVAAVGVVEDPGAVALDGLSAAVGEVVGHFPVGLQMYSRFSI